MSDFYTGDAVLRDLFHALLDHGIHDGKHLSAGEKSTITWTTRQPATDSPPQPSAGRQHPSLEKEPGK